MGVSWGLRQRDWPFGTAKRKKRSVCVWGGERTLFTTRGRMETSAFTFRTASSSCVKWTTGGSGRGVAADKGSLRMVGSCHLGTAVGPPGPRPWPDPTLQTH